MFFEDEPLALSVPCAPPKGHSTPRLFHGPAAYSKAVEWIESWGLVWKQAGKASSLKVQEARDLIELLNMPTLGYKPCAILVGLDLADQHAVDPFLKALEDGVGPGCPLLVLWVSDLTGCVGTVRSRCLPVWSPGPESVNLELLESLPNHLTGCARLIQGMTSKDTKAWLEALAVAILDGKVPVSVWGQVRTLPSMRSDYLCFLDLLLPQEPQS